MSADRKKREQTKRHPAAEEIKGMGRTVLGDLQRSDLGLHFKRDLHDLYHFYLDEESRARLQRMGRVKQVLSIAWWLLKSLIMRLTPTRRLMLIVSIWFILVGEFSLRGDNFDFSFSFSKFGYVILLVILMLELKDKLLARDELAVGRAVQLALMPCESPDIQGWDCWLFTRPANDVGGDLVDFMPLAEGASGLALGDVSGKGLGAALLMAKLQATLRSYAGDVKGEGTIAEMGGRVNRLLCRDGLANRFATLLFLSVEPDSGTVHLLNAGHMPPLVLSGSEIRVLPPVAPLLGVLPAAAFVEQAVELAPGDLLVVYSDGLTEAMNRAEEFFGDERLMALLLKLGGLSAKEAGRTLLAAVDAFIGDERPSDDLSLVILRRAIEDRCEPAVNGV